MKILLWQAAILPGKEAELEAYANTLLLQFFQQQPGCLGVSFFQHGQQFQLLSYWHHNKDAQQMLASEAHQKLTTLLLQRYLLAAMPAEFAQIQGGFLSQKAQQQLAFCHATETLQPLAALCYG
ncbi:antibiotic biosynthesis monooxygenase family protein [Rheinheimera sp. 4Y26]|uniref:antibiotic biosynthesis monooxygenase family protein n=1 Tax=Rheinheimera sp. 4Y26 TaxID=2977811 RepID=UPI0021B099CC|nr:antibiotic biosynthesis monooxygenase [Rheinheimera sp. 4Y26]MCT6698360.1 hypothetical protein [Rheinheimera sp. 4Y26]